MIDTLAKFLTQRPDIFQSIYYAGIGSRETPEDIKEIMKKVATKLETFGYILRSGGAIGADLAFERGVKNLNNKEIYYAKDATELSQRIALHFHPSPQNLKKNKYALNLMARNTFQIMGKSLDNPVQFVICWTQDGCKHFSTRTRATGGTAQAISIASFFNIPIYNLKNEEDLKHILNLIQG